MELFELFIYIAAGAAMFLLVYGITAPTERKYETVTRRAPQSQARSEKAFGGSVSFLARMGAGRASKQNPENARYLRLLKKADWFWQAGEPMPPNPKAPFWSLETLWTEKLINASIYGILGASLPLLIAIVLSINIDIPILLVIPVAVLLAVALAGMGYTNPDQQLTAAATRRQSELSLEMGYRISELRADVLAGLTIQRAVAEMAARPGGPFVEELRRVVAVLRSKGNDDIVAMDSFIDRNKGNELVEEFANQVKLVSQRGGQISHALNILSDSAQQRLKIQINAQALKNLSAMQMPLSGSQVLILSLLVILPVAVGIFTAVQG